MPVVKQYYAELVAITEDYLGPAAKRFIDRQITNHLHKEPGDLSRQELSKLIDWSILAIGFLTDDSRIKADYSTRIKQLEKGKTPA